MTGLPQPRTAEGRAGLAAVASDPARALLAFDFDGTLAPIVADPAAARAHPGAVPALRVLAPLVGTLVIVTGRPARTAVDYGDLAGMPPGLTVLGHYGWERWESGTGQASAPAPPSGLALVRDELPGMLSAHPGARIEDKGLAVAVHTRGATRPQETLQALHAPLADLAERAGLRLEPGRLVLELRPAGMDKGAALRAFAVARSPGAVLFAGDDLADLPAFDAVAELRRAGVPGITVCSGSAEATELAGRADLVVDGPGGVVSLLEHLGAALARR